MGAKRCNVAGCKSAQNRVEDAGVTYHQLPVNIQTRLIWLKASRVRDDPNIKVCSRHFREADFKLIKTKYFLVKGTYPTIFPWGVYTHENPPEDDPASATVEEDPLAGAVPPVDPIAVTSPPDLPSLAVVMVKEEPGTVQTQAAKVKRESLTGKRHSIAAVETIKKEPIDAVDPKRLMRKSMESATPLTVKKVEPVAGKEIEAMDFQNVWHKAKIVEVDLVERELLIHFEDNNKEK